MRGALAADEFLENSGGIIPAYAGSTDTFVLDMADDGDHPRVCGEHASSGARSRGAGGSSPRMRGALHRGDERGASRGIIPAYAGSTKVPRAI